MSPDPRLRVLVVQDDEALRDRLCEELRGRGHVPVAAATVADGLEQLKQAEFDVALLALVLPDGSGVEVLKRIAEEELATASVVLTGHATVEDALRAVAMGAYGYLTKPARIEELEVVMAKAAETSRLRRENGLLRRRLEGQAAAAEVVTGDPAMKDLLATLARVAPSDLPVLVQGENGTGKELVARALHRLSPRAREPFVAARCAAVPADRLESELFGHERGAFEGATTRERGLFEAADRGVLFLDEVGEIPGPVQGKVLRAIEGRELVRVGGSHPVRADVRIVAATSRDLRKEMQEGRFREDLYYRLDGVTVTVPPLRERRGDIALLARHLLSGFAPGKKLTARALEALQAYGWPGNVRELEMVVRRAALLTPADTIDAGDLPLDVRDQNWKGAAGRAGLSLAEMEREYIETVLRQHDGHRGKTARALGIDPKTLYNKLGPERPRKKPDAAGEP